MRATLLSIFLFMSMLGFTQSIAVDVTEGCSPLKVSFSVSGTNSATYSWDFGDGAVSVLPSPENEFVDPNVYTVTVILDNGVKLTQDIDVFALPVPTILIPADNQGCVGKTIDFSATVVEGGGGSVVNYEWNFGDFQKEDTSNDSIAHTYNRSGAMDIDLTVTDAFGCEGVAVKQVDAVFISDTPIITKGNYVSFACDPPLTVNYNVNVELNSGDGSTNATYLWTFDDGSTSDQASVQKDYTLGGTYPVTLEVTDNIGCTGYFDDVTAVGKPIAEIDIPDQLCDSAYFTVGNNSSDGNYRWEMGNGMTSTLRQWNYRYDIPGTYEITLIVTSSSGACADTATHTVEVEKVEASFDIDRDWACQYPFTINLNNTSSDVDSFRWVLPDGSEDKINATTAHTLTWVPRGEYIKDIQDDYTVSLEIHKHNCSKSIQRNVTVKRPISEIQFAQNDTGIAHGCIPLQVQFEDISVEDTSIDNYQYFWGDGTNTVTSDTIVNHIFNQTGQFDVFMVLTDDFGCKDTSYVLQVQAGDQANLGFSANNTTVCLGDEVTFINLTPSTDTIDYWHIQTDDYNSSPILEEDSFITIPFNSQIGSVDVLMLASWNGCVTSKLKSSMITVEGPRSYFNADLDCTRPFDRSFVATFEDADAFTWDFGDGNSSTDSFPTHTYAASGNYTVALTASNSGNACSDYVYSKTVYIRDIQSSFNYVDQNIVCVDDTIEFDASSSIDYMGSSLDVANYDTAYQRSCYLYPFTWLWNDSSFASRSFSSNMPHELASRGAFNVQLITRDINWCADTASIDITSMQLIAGFETDVDAGCIPFEVRFTDTSSADTTIASWKYYYDTGDSSDLATNTYLYELDTSEYTISLIVEDELGCLDTVYKTIAPSRPDLGFALNGDDTTFCVGDQIHLYYNGMEEVLTDLDGHPHEDSLKAQVMDEIYSQIYTWQIGDDTLIVDSLSDSLFFNITQAGRYQVVLTVQDSLGCYDSISKSLVFAADEYPQAFISMDTTENTFCFSKGKFLEFFDSSYNSSTLPQANEWIFQDQDSLMRYVQDVSSISVEYGRPGDFFMSLVSTSEFGCADTVEHVVSMSGPSGVVSVFPNEAICRGDTFTFSIQDTSFIDFVTLAYGDGVIDTVLGPDFDHYHAYQITNPYGEFPVRTVFYSPNGCSLDTSYAAKVWAVYADFTINQVDSVTSDTVACLGVPFNFTNHSLFSTTFNWDYGDGTSSASETAEPHFYTSPGTYEVTLSVIGEVDGNDVCTDTTKMGVQVLPKPSITISEDTILCEGGIRTMKASGGIQYYWAPNTAIDSTDTIFTNDKNEVIEVNANPSEATRYVVSVTDQFGCEDTSSTFIDINLAPIPFEYSDTITIGDTVPLTVDVGEGFTYEWTTANMNDFIECDDCDSLKIFPHEPTNGPEEWQYYTLRVYNHCFDEEYPVSILVKPQFSVVMPTAFTPGGDDGVNDIMYVKGWGIKDLKEFKVYNRWGELVFETVDLSEGWDGTYRGELQAVDSYVWVVSVEFYDGTEDTFTGSITIIQ